MGVATRKNINTPSPWEGLRGYSRAVVIGDQMWVSGTTATSANGEVVSVGDPYAQTKFVLEKIKSIVESEGFSIADVVRTRMSVTKIQQWAEYARAHREMFEQIRPASSIVEVSRLTDARLMVEIEADLLRLGN